MTLVQIKVTESVQLYVSEYWRCAYTGALYGTYEAFRYKVSLIVWCVSSQ